MSVDFETPVLLWIASFADVPNANPVYVRKLFAELARRGVLVA